MKKIRLHHCDKCKNYFIQDYKMHCPYCGGYFFETLDIVPGEENFRNYFVGGCTAASEIKAEIEKDPEYFIEQFGSADYTTVRDALTDMGGDLYEIDMNAVHLYLFAISKIKNPFQVIELEE